MENKENKAIQENCQKQGKKEKTKKKKTKAKTKEKEEKKNKNKEKQRKTESEKGWWIHWAKGVPFLCAHPEESGHSVRRVPRTGVGRLARSLGRSRSPGVLATLVAFSFGFGVWGFRV